MQKDCHSAYGRVIEIIQCKILQQHKICTGCAVTTWEAPEKIECSSCNKQLILSTFKEIVNRTQSAYFYRLLTDFDEYCFPSCENLALGRCYMIMLAKNGEMLYQVAPHYIATHQLAAGEIIRLFINQAENLLAYASPYQFGRQLMQVIIQLMICIFGCEKTVFTFSNCYLVEDIIERILGLLQMNCLIYVLPSIKKLFITETKLTFAKIRPHSIMYLSSKLCNTNALTKLFQNDFQLQTERDSEIIRINLDFPVIAIAKGNYQIQYETRQKPVDFNTELFRVFLVALQDPSLNIDVQNPFFEKMKINHPNIQQQKVSRICQALKHFLQVEIIGNDILKAVCGLCMYINTNVSTDEIIGYIMTL